jgi:hypothetical protein
MKRNNIYNLPQRVLDVIDGLNPIRPRPDKNVVHVTDLLLPAYAWNLYREKWDEITEDYSDYLISVQGDALHEAYKKYLPDFFYYRERHFEQEIDGVKLVGTCDVYDTREDELVDLKQTSVWSPGYKLEDYTKQTNCYSWFLNKEGKTVKKISIDVWYRNWNLKDSTRNHEYPSTSFETIDIPVWPIEKTEQFIKDQIEYLTMCKDPCSRQDKWQKFSAMRSTNGKEKVTPDKNFDTREEAERWIANWTPAASCLKSMPKGKISWRIKNGEPLSCLRYCKARSACSFALSLKGK